MQKKSWRKRKAVLAAVGAFVYAMIQMGSQEAEANFCSWFQDASENCLGWFPVELIQIAAIILILWWATSFFGSRIANLMQGLGIVVFWPHQTHGKVKRAQMWAIIGMVIGGLLFIGCLTYIVVQNTVTNAAIQQSLQRYVLPRRLTKEQENIIGDYLKKHESKVFRFEVVKDNEEASQYRADLQRALKQGGWQMSNIDHLADMREGIRTRFLQTPETRNQKDPDHPKADELFQEAMRQAGIELHGSSRGGSDTGEDEFTIQIGPRRMDDADIQGREEAIREAQKTLRGEV